MISIKPSNIYLKNFMNDENLHNQYYSWISSIYQLIIDLNIPDIETNKNLSQKDIFKYNILVNK